MITITFTKTSMATGDVVKIKEFSTEKEGMSFFHEVADELNYHNMTEDVNSARRLYEIGGLGYDYRIELEIACV